MNNKNTTNTFSRVLMSILLTVPLLFFVNSASADPLLSIQPELAGSANEAEAVATPEQAKDQFCDNTQKTMDAYKAFVNYEAFSDIPRINQLIHECDLDYEGACKQLAALVNPHFPQSHSLWTDLDKAIHHFVNENSSFLPKVNVPRDVFNIPSHERVGMEAMEDGHYYFDFRLKELKDTVGYIHNSEAKARFDLMTKVDRENYPLFLYQYIDRMEHMMGQLEELVKLHCPQPSEDGQASKKQGNQR